MDGASPAGGERRTYESCVDPGAPTIDRLSYAEAAALARAGAKMLHPRTLDVLVGTGIPVYVGCTLRPDGPGTWIGPAATAIEATIEAAPEEAREDGTAA